MALAKNKISIPFTTGLQTKSDEKQDNLEGLRVLENVIFDTPKKLLKRKGYDKVNLEQLDGSDITDPKFLANFENELGLFTNSNYFSHANSIDKWTDKGQVFTAFPTSKTIVRNNYEQRNIDIVNTEDINAYVYSDFTGVRVSILDNSNCNFLLSDELVSATGERARVCSIQNTIYIFYIDGTDLKYRKVNIINPQTIEPEVVFAADVESTDKIFDCLSMNNKIFIAYNSSASGGTIKVATIDSGDLISSAITITGENASTALTIDSDSNSRLLISYYNGTDVKALIYSANLGSQLLAPTIIETIAGVKNVNITQPNTSTTSYTMFYEVSAASAKDHYVKKNTITLAGSVGTASVLKRSVGMASKSFSFNNKAYTTVIHESTLQSTYFILDEDSRIISKISPNIGGNLSTENVLSEVSLLGDNKFLLGTQVKGRTTIDADKYFSLLGVNSTSIDFDLDDPFQNEVLGKNLHIAGGIPMMYDGKEVVEHGFHIFPEDLENPLTASVGGFMSDGAYQYSAVYSWTDNKGLIHRSAPSIGFAVTISGGTATQLIDIKIPTLRLTQKENAIIELYRTEAAGTIFYKVTTVDEPFLNDTTIDSQTVRDKLSDTDLIAREVLYTTGGVLDNIAAPSSSIIESFSDRIILAGLENQNALHYSKIRFEGAPVEFNDTLTIQVNSKGGPITAIKTMDEKLIIFKETAIFYLSGDGPNNIGQQDTFIKPELISSDIGCININSVVLTPDGLMFKSKKGIYLLTRGIGLSYIGHSVEKFNDLKISSATVIPEDNQVRFTTEDGDALVYNYFVQQWASFSNHKAISGININFTYYYLRPDSLLYVESESNYNDNGSPINIKLQSGWISFADVQGFQRIYKLLLLSTFKSEHKLRIRIAYDFNDAFIQEAIIDPSDFIDETKYGGDSPYGEPTTKAYGGDGNVYQMRVNLKRQKCQSIKISIEEIQSDSTNLGEGLSISNIMLEVGQKSGTNKVEKAKKYGTS